MGVQIDAPTMFRIDCDHTGKCYHRLYLYCANEKVAAVRAEAEYGWQRQGDLIKCRDHKGPH